MIGGFLWKGQELAHFPAPAFGVILHPLPPALDLWIMMEGPSQLKLAFAKAPFHGEVQRSWKRGFATADSSYVTAPAVMFHQDCRLRQESVFTKNN